MASPRRARAFLEQREDQLKQLLPWLAVELDGAAPPAVPSGSLKAMVTDPLKRLVRLNNAMLVGDQGAADARAAAELVVGGLAAGLPASEEGGVDGLLRMLHSEGCWAALDALASGPGLPLFDGGEAGIYELDQLAHDSKGRWRLPRALQAVAERRGAAGDWDGATGLFLLAHVEEGARPAAGPLARHLSAELLSAGGRAWLAQAVRASLEWRLQEFAEALCQHGGLECVARLAAALPEAAEADSARRGLALALVAKAGPGECENLFAEVPGFRAALARVAEALGAVVAAGAPQAPNPGGWALPEGLVAALQCSNAPGPGELCTVCQPVAAFMRSFQLETATLITYEQGELAANQQHIDSMLKAAAQRCPELRSHINFRVLDAWSQEKRRKGQPKRKVAAIRCWKLDTWHKQRLERHREAKQQAQQLAAVLAAAPAETAAPEAAAEEATTAECEALAAGPEPQPLQAEVEAAPAAEAAAAVAEAAEPQAPSPAAELVAAAAEEPAVEAPGAAVEAPAAAAEAEAATDKQAAAAPGATPAAEAVEEEEAPAAEPAAASPAVVAAAEAAVSEAAAAEELSQPAEAGAEAQPVAQPMEAEEAQAAAQDSPAAPQGSPAAAAAAATPGAAAAAVQLMDVDEAPAAEEQAHEACTPASQAPTSKPSLVQCTLTSATAFCALPPPELPPSRRLSLGAASSATPAGGSTGKKRAAAGSTAAKDTGPGSRKRAALRKMAAALKLPTLLRWFRPDSQGLSQEQWQALSSQGVAPRALQFGGVEADSATSARPPAAPPAQAGRSKRSRRG